jgi:hypothetical protein
LLALQLELGIADGFSFGVCVGVLVLDDSARSSADEHSVQHEYCSVRLIAPGLGEASHLFGCVGPPGFWLAPNSLSSGRLSNGARGERHCEREEGSSPAWR